MTLLDVQIKAIRTADFVVILLKQVTFYILFIFAPLSVAPKAHQLYPDWQRAVAGQ